MGGERSKEDRLDQRNWERQNTTEELEHREKEKKLAMERSAGQKAKEERQTQKDRQTDGQKE